MKDKRNGIINLVLLFITIGINALGAFGFINGMSQQEVSDKYPTLITPPSFTFSIWGLIYTLLIISMVYLVVKSTASYSTRFSTEISPYFWLSCLFNIGWIVTFSFEMIFISVIFIILLLLSLVMLTRKAAPIRNEKNILVPISFGIYSGWILIATVVNIAALLVSVNWNGFGISEEIWTIIILIAAAAIALGVHIKVRNVFLPLPIAWAYIGIGILHRDLNNPIIMALAFILAIVLVLMSIKMFFDNNRKFTYSQE